MGVVMREPWFWKSRSRTGDLVAALLTPAAIVYQFGHNIRTKLTTPFHAGVPVICIGNATLGGAGKTPFAMMVASMLSDQGVNCFFLTRGFGGAETGPLRVDANKHDHTAVGDEALLLEKCAPTIVSRNRPDGARLAQQSGADIIIMDDGFQNLSLRKDISILLTDNNRDVRHERLFPAGPFREPLEKARARADIVVNVGAPNETRAPKADFAAWLAPVDPPAPIKAVAFAGIGKPAKFFQTLDQLGFDLAEQIAFPDHHHFTDAQLVALTRNAKRHAAQLITTEKDYVRLPEAFRENVAILPVAMQVSDPPALKELLSARINAARRAKRDGA